MLIIGWKTNDYRGKRAWAAYWSREETKDLHAQAVRHIAEQGLEDGCVFIESDELSIGDAKRNVLAYLGGDVSAWGRSLRPGWVEIKENANA